MFFLLVTLPIHNTYAQEGQVVDRIIAVVDDEIILESEVLQFVQDIALRNKGMYQSESEIEELKQQVLEEIVVQKILLAAALEDTNIIVEDREVDQTLDERLNQIIEQVGSEEKLEEYYGKPIRQIRREYRKQVRDGLYAEKIRGFKLANVSVSRPEVEDFYERNSDDLPTLPEQVRLAHILILIQPTDEAKQIAKTKADSVYQLLLLGEDFAQLAMDYSDDRPSGDKGGLIGTTERGDLVPEYEEVAFALEEGEISQPVKSRYGYHIIKLNWRRGEKINTSHVLTSLIPSSEDEQRAQQNAANLRQKALDGGDFSNLAMEHSQDEETSKIGGDIGWFELPNMPDEFRFVAMELEPGEISEPFKTRFGFHVLKMSDRTESRPMGLIRDWERMSRMAMLEKQDAVYR